MSLSVTFQLNTKLYMLRVVNVLMSAKVSQYALLPQGQPEREKRALAMRAAMDAEGFGHCTNEYECEAACPKAISVTNIARLNREYMRAMLLERPQLSTRAD